MLYLILSILLNAYLGVVFTYFKKYHIDSFQAIVINYWVCVMTGSVVLGQFPISNALIEEPWFGWALLMGSLFVTIFTLIAISTHHVGVTITQTANKLSLAIPVLASYYLYNEPISLLKWAGIGLALVSVILVSAPASGSPLIDDKCSNNRKPIWIWILPIILFVGSGIIDSLTAYVKTYFLHTTSDSNTYLICGFATAASWGSIRMLYLLLTQKISFSIRNVWAGLILGIPNYFSIYFLIKALQNPNMNTTATIPINNIGILLVVSIVGIMLFKEKLSVRNYLGLALSVLAILLIFVGDII